MTVLNRLEATIAARKAEGDASSSHTAALLGKGPAKCAEKFGEEAIEAIIEAVRGDKAALTTECADVIYHMLVMLAAQDVPLADVLAELERREGTSGIEEKAGREVSRTEKRERVRAFLSAHGHAICDKCIEAELSYSPNTVNHFCREFRDAGEIARDEAQCPKCLVVRLVNLWI